MICVPTSLDQEVGEALGAQAGEAKLTEVLSEGGFTPRAARHRRPLQHGARSEAVGSDAWLRPVALGSRSRSRQIASAAVGEAVAAAISID